MRAMMTAGTDTQLCDSKMMSRKNMTQRRRERSSVR